MPANLNHKSPVRTLGMATALTLMMTVAATAQTFRFSAFEVDGNQRIEDATILNYIGITPGAAVSAGKLNDGYQRLQASGLFERVEMIPQGNRLIVVVQEFPTINQINFEGNSSLKAENLQAIVQSQPRRVYNPAQAERDAEAITDAYAASGRLAASVTPKIIRRSDNRVDLVFEVAEGRVTEVERLSFVGNRVYSDRRLRRVLESSQAGIFRALIRSDTFVADRVAFDQQLLRDFYLSRGYIDARVLSVTPELSPQRNGYFLTFRVQEGQQFRFANVSISSDLDIDIEAYEDQQRIKEGDVYNPAAVDRMIERLELLAVREGRNFIRVVPRVTRNDADLTLDVDFVVERGERIFVERIDIEGNATTLDRVIRREFDTVEGDPFNPRAIRAAAERIRALGFFANADVSARDGSAPDRVVIDVDVEEQTTGSLGFGLNYSVQNGAGVSLSFSETNFLGRGQGLNFVLDTGSDSQNSVIQFTEPHFLNRDLTLSTGLSYTTTESQNASFDTESIGFNLGFTFPTGEDSALSVFYKASRDTLDAKPATAASTSRVILADEGTTTTSSLGYNWSYDTRKTGLDPNRGFLLSLGQEFAGLGGDQKFVKTSFQAEAVSKVWNEEVTLSLAFEGGNIASFGNTQTRQSNRFFNSQSIIRGFEASGIGPRELAPGVESDPLGGNNYFAIRAEAQFPLGFVPDEYGMSGAVFYDVGAVWGLDNTTGGPAAPGVAVEVDDSMHLRSAIGVGINWDTQIGPLRFNFTRAIDKQSYDKVQNFDLTIQTRF